MAHRTVHRLACLVSLLAVTSATKEQSRWSRQLSTYTSDISDWVPLRGPIEREPEIQQPQIKRQAVAEPRILTEPFPGLPRPTGFSSDAFSSRNYFNAPSNRQLYLQSVPSVPSAPQNFLTDQGFGQSIRFGLSPNNFPLNQGFVAQPFNFENGPLPQQPKAVRPQQPIQPIPMHHVSFPQSSGVPLSIQSKPFLNPSQRPKSDTPKFVDGYRAENASNEFNFAKKKPQSLQKIKFESGEKVKQEIIPQHGKNDRGEEVQLLYVPLEQINRGQYNLRNPLTASQVMGSELYSQSLPRPIPGKQTFLNEYRPGLKPIDNFSGQNYFPDFNGQFKDVDQVSKFTTLTTPFATFPPVTPKPKKLKPHQPPLAIFMTKDASKSSAVKVGDVLSSSKTAETIAVLDSVNPLNAPKVFIGPSNLPPPENFVKFELPYLSNIEHSDNKLKQLPFFVAPLSYKTPNGFAKIPFPSPHVGSVVINSQIKETPQTNIPLQPSSNPNYYTVTNKPELKPVTQKPTFSYYSTANPNTKPVPNYQSNHYSFEPQTVTSLRTQQPETQTAPPKASYFLSNAAPQYNPQDFSNFAPQKIDPFHFSRQPELTTTLRTTTTSTTAKPPSTYPSPLLETHNPYSINQAFHFSTPLDYHNYFDDVKQPYVTPGPVGQQSLSPSSTPAPPSPSSQAPEQIITEKPKYHQQSSPSYLNNYSPEIHYNSDNSKYPVYNPSDYTSKIEVTSQQTESPSTVDNTPVYKYSNVGTSGNRYSSNVDTPTNQYTNLESEVNNYNIDNYNKYNTNVDTSVNDYKADTGSLVNAENYKTLHSQTVDSSSPQTESPSGINNAPTISDTETPPKYNEYNSYENNQDDTDVSPTSSTTTTTTRRSPIRSRGRPRYTTTPRSDSYESTTKLVVTRRPLRERRPLPTRSRYEPNKISTEKPTRKPLDSSSESTTKSSRTRTRGRIHYRPSDSDEQYDRKKTNNGKDEDLAYQRDVLHQNYPVTLMERMSTVDIEAITEPTPRQTSIKLQEPVTETIDTENAYTNERLSITEQEEIKDGSPSPTFTSRSTLQTETPYVPKLPSTRNDEYYYQSRSSLAPFDASGYDETTNDKDEDIYTKQTTPVPKTEKTETIEYGTETAVTEQNEPNYSSYSEYATINQDEANTAAEVEDTKSVDTETPETEEDNVVQTTPSYNRVRVRPGVIRQYHQASSTESTKTKERRRPSQPVTYRPAFDRRRTTMRIDEIEADLKTKQVHARPEQEYRHPVYKPEATTEPTPAAPSTAESTTKKGHFRRRRPSYSYSTTSTEAPSTKRIYEVKNRFRGRRPTEKPTEKVDAQTDAPVSTTRASLHTRYSHRPRLSERYNKKPEPETEVEDQDSNFSINRPKYVEPETSQWSPKISLDTFKPYNPNDIADDPKIATTERRSDKESDLDIITARNEYDDILLTVTPASNNRMNKKIPDIPPTLEALVEQSKVTKSESSDSMSTFESMLEEVMKSLEEQDQNEYSTNVMKHKGGEIGEIPPERIISSGDSYVPKSTVPLEATTTEQVTADDSSSIDEDNEDRKTRRRGFWKKVKVRPVTTESIEFAESQYYTNTVNRLGQPIKNKAVHEKSEKSDKTKVTTYKPKLQFISDLFSSGDDLADVDPIPLIDIHKITKNDSDNEETLVSEESKRTTVYVEKESQTISPGDLDLGTGSPDPTIDDLYLTTPTEPTTSKAEEKESAFNFMSYLFGMTSGDSENQASEEKNATQTTEAEIQITTEQPKAKIVTTESGFIPEEFTASSVSSDSTDVSDTFGMKEVNPTEYTRTEKLVEDTTTVNKVESSSVSSFMNPANVLSTSMSTEVSHETEICFRGKCIKTSKDIL